MAEIEIGVMAHQCLERRITSQDAFNMAFLQDSPITPEPGTLYACSGHITHTLLDKAL